ncbi:tyrosine-type recombinase/integrase [Streptomyces sp. SL13]|uniref:Tyrosine-type recombinase/integrase n=1 Tax=Streptantibioticus silvisoli TaxID=2705255 RepID=A0AA90H6J0_9ACTN|nr:tyrosine-type recombinase/integrase [Streptantibioticus silvisoli]MDI5971873.1 tyrosine-type recombinase/integrase [Streptantibioticus silvisoli]
MPLTFDVRIYAIEFRKDRPKPHRVRWLVGTQKHSKSYAIKAQADGRRSELMSALRRGEQFDEELGLPVSEIRAARQRVTWYEHTRAFIDRKWAAAPAKSRKNYADALATITPALLRDVPGRPSAPVLRRALYGWAYNRNRWDETPPADIAAALAWVERNSVGIAELETAYVVRQALDALALKLDGTRAAAKTATRKRACLSDVLNLALEQGYFSTPVNPLSAIRWKAPKSVEEVDPESVVNPRQMRQLLAAVREQGSRGRHLEAFFGCLYHAAMRPAEASALKRTHCHLPVDGWGELTLRGGVVRAGRGWTNDGRAHEDRHLKARAVRDSRVVPIPPHFVRLLREHIDAHGVAPDGRLFRTERGGLLQETGYGEVWARARAQALGEDDAASLLARRPYDLRHAGVSFWLSSGVDPVEVARRAGHSVAVLLRVYAKVLAHTRERSNVLIDAALREWNEPG